MHIFGFDTRLVFLYRADFRESRFGPDSDPTRGPDSGRNLFPGYTRTPENASLGPEFFFPDIPGHPKMQCSGPEMGPEIGPKSSPENESGEKIRFKTILYNVNGAYDKYMLSTPPIIQNYCRQS